MSALSRIPFGIPDGFPDYDSARKRAREQGLLDAIERRAHEDEVADGLQSKPDWLNGLEWEDTCS